jgi:hypothetical protein
MIKSKTSPILPFSFLISLLLVIANASSNAMSNKMRDYSFNMIINLPSSKSSIIGRNNL